MNKKIYLDYASTTPLDPRVFVSMKPFFSKKFGSPFSLHRFGQETKEAVDRAKEKIAQILGCKSQEIIFTSGATEADTLAILGTAFAQREKGNHIITSTIEHSAILEACQYLEEIGFKITYLPVGKSGLVNLSDLKKSLTDKTILVSIMYVNGEIGTIQPIEKISQVIRQTNKKVIFHTDATQAVGHLPIKVKSLGVDLLNFGAHKIYGPKGVGLLFVRQNVKLSPYFGSKKASLHIGTDNVPGIVGLAKALELVEEDREKEARRLKRLQDKLINGVLSSIPNSCLNGDRIRRIATNTNFSFKGVEGEALTIHLDLLGVAASTGSACASKQLEPSHVLLALGLKPSEAQGSLRLTLGRGTKEEDIDYVLKVLPKIVARLRKMAPKL